MKNYNYLSSELCKLGITKKEAEVYLVLLKMGYASVQKIAEEVGLSRPTVYRVLKDLKKKNLINTIQKGKRNYFIAGSPDALLNMLQIKKRQAEEQEREFLRIINTLQDQYSFSAKDKNIQTFSDKERRLAIDKLVNTQSSKAYVFLTTKNKELEQVIADTKKKRGSSLNIKQLQSFETKSAKVDKSKQFKNGTQSQNIIITDRVFIFEKDSIHVIKQKNSIKSYKLMFESIWKNI